MKINRLLEMVYILLRKKAVTAKELAERFEVSQRTIYRDIDVLSSAGIPIYTEKGKGGGISLLPDFVLSKSILSSGEQQEILSALHGLSAVGATGTDDVLCKLSALFNKNTVNWIDVDFSDWNIDNKNTFQDLKTAIIERRIVTFDYFGAYSSHSRRTVEPIQLCFKSKAWYLKGFCLMRQDVRLFKLLRITDLSVTSESYEERSLSALTDKSFFSSASPLIHLKLEIEPAMAFRVYDDFPKEHISPLPNGSFLVSVTCPEEAWLYGYILSYGAYARVVSPAHIRDIIKDTAQKIYEQNHEKSHAQSHEKSHAQSHENSHAQSHENSRAQSHEQSYTQSHEQSREKTHK